MWIFNVTSISKWGGVNGPRSLAMFLSDLVIGYYSSDSVPCPVKFYFKIKSDKPLNQGKPSTCGSLFFVYPSVWILLCQLGPPSDPMFCFTVILYFDQAPHQYQLLNYMSCGIYSYHWYSGQCCLFQYYEFFICH